MSYHLKIEPVEPSFVRLFLDGRAIRATRRQFGADPESEFWFDADELDVMFRAVAKALHLKMTVELAEPADGEEP